MRGRFRPQRWGGRGEWKHGRPPWWPETEPWPPAGPPGPPAWRRMRGHFLRRMAFGLVVFITLIASSAALLFWAVASLFGLLAGPAGSAAVPAGLALILVLLVGGLFVTMRAFRRFAVPVGALLEAAARVSEGDYAARVPEHGPREVRTLARAFNAMTARLQQHEEQRRSLLADISHELRTPLAVIEGNLEGLLDGVYPRDDEHLGIVLEEARVLSRLVEDLRTLTLADDAGLNLAKGTADLADLAHDVVGSFAAQAEGRKITLQVDAPADLPRVYVDPERIRQVLTNLLSNALRYTSPGGTIRVRVLREGADRIAVAVEDTGTGIPPEDLPHIFDRFYKSKDSRGTGLGLAIAKSLVAAHGGEIAVSSEPGRGTTIRFALPLDPGAG